MNNQTQTSDYQNTSAQEIEKFSQHAHEWWDEQGPLKTLHQINPTRMAWIAKHADLANAQTIDIGCGGGILSESLAKAGALVTGLDMASDSIEIARTHAQAAQLNIDYQISTAEAWAQAHPAEYEVVTCMELLEHVPDPASVIHAAAQLLAPSGVVFFSTINRNPKAWALTIGAAEHLLKWIPKGTHQYDTFIKPSELSAMARQSGLEVIALAGVGYQPWKSKTNSFVATQDTSVNYMMACRKAPQ
jgi:2-polyprenyl-6-hydroxyphenyl methylase/3-demethylubiquinone-9 3-methyltransferase